MLESHRNARGWPSGATILVVEDDESVSAMVSYLLEIQEVHCVITRNAEDGWHAILAEAPAAAIVDLRLPGRDGWWLLRRIRARRGTHRLPMVLITGFLDDTVVIQAADLTCECLGKPFTFTELMDRLDRACELAAGLPELPPTNRRAGGPA